MGRISVPIAFFVFLLFLSTACSESEEVKQALISFMANLTLNEVKTDPNFGWNSGSDPCTNKWRGVTCDEREQTVKRIILDDLNMTGVLDASSLCKTTSLSVLSLKGNNLNGELGKEIVNCRHLTHVYLNFNRFSGSLPVDLSKLSNLKRIDISNNWFSGQLPDMSRISGLLTFLAQNNNLSGALPNFDFANLSEFNVSNNNFTGLIPDVNIRFDESSFSGNTELCGKPLSKTCPVAESKKKTKKSKTHYVIYFGFAILGLALIFFIILGCFKRKAQKNKKAEIEALEKGRSKKSNNQSEYSIPSTESGNSSSNSLVVLSSPLPNGLKFEHLLQAPAELVGSGRHGTLYKVVLNDGVNVAVKRIKDWGITKDDFIRRMQRLHQVRHPNVVPALAYYCSKQEKLLVYEFQNNGSLFKLLHGSQNGQLFDWRSRLSIAAGTTEALAFMHIELHNDKIAHGNLKLTNILLNKDMEPYISEYGLMVVENNSDRLSGIKPDDSTNDVYALGVVLLELLTGKLVNNKGFNLASWVHSVVREGWTVEVFDKALVSQKANEDGMVNLLYVALKCINPSPEARPTMVEVAEMIRYIKEEDEKSISSDQ